MERKNSQKLIDTEIDIKDIDDEQIQMSSFETGKAEQRKHTFASALTNFVIDIHDSGMF